MKIKSAIISILMLSSFLGIASAQTATVSIESAGAPHGGIAVAAITINDVIDAAAININLTYNKSVVHVLAVSNGSFQNTISNINNDTGSTRIGGFQVTDPGLNGNFILTNVTLGAVGNFGQVSPLNISIETLVNSTDDPIPASPVNGTFTITGATQVPSATLPGMILLVGLLGLVAAKKMKRRYR